MCTRSTFPTSMAVFLPRVRCNLIISDGVNIFSGEGGGVNYLLQHTDIEYAFLFAGNHCAIKPLIVNTKNVNTHNPAILICEIVHYVSHYLFGCV